MNKKMEKPNSKHEEDDYSDDSEKEDKKERTNGGIWNSVVNLFSASGDNDKVKEEIVHPPPAPSLPPHDNSNNQLDSVEFYKGNSNFNDKHIDHFISYGMDVDLLYDYRKVYI